MNHIKLNDDYRSALLESASWDRVGLAINEGTEEAVQEVVEEAKDADNAEEAEVVELSEEEYAEHQEAILNVIIEEAIEQDVFGELIDRAGSVHAACTQIAESSDEYDEEEIVYAALQEVFPNQFGEESDEE
jgi:hypothetical protein|tara:strand:+ start:110 stop:505 length:396 start_codon:yes stop_codon:yes gene_type:complete